MDRKSSHYLEISGRIASGRRFCEFLSAGGKVWQQPDTSVWKDVTIEVMERENRRLVELEQLRAFLYPELTDVDDRSQIVTQ